MCKDYRTVKTEGSGEITEKKSRFIATVRPVETEEEAISFVSEMKKKYWDARHNCSAYVIGKKNELTRCSDDGEPGGTAGKPMLEVLLGSSLTNTAVVVTRYFGGTLLGTGGLIKAYTQAVQEGLKEAGIITMKYGEQIKILIEYSYLGKIQALLGNEEAKIINITYDTGVKIDLLLPQKKVESIRDKITEITAAQVVFQSIEKLYFVDKE